MSDNLKYIDRLVKFANDLGYDVELESKMEDYKAQQIYKLTLQCALGQISEADLEKQKDEEYRPAGSCSYDERLIRIREGKSDKGKVSTLIHELVHALGLGGRDVYTWLGESYIELVAESVTEFVTREIGIDRTAKTSNRILHYGYGDYLSSPISLTVSRIILDQLKD